MGIHSKQSQYFPEASRQKGRLGKEKGIVAHGESKFEHLPVLGRDHPGSPFVD